MEKRPVEIFIAQQLKEERYKTIIAQLGVDPVIVQAALISYLKDQGVNFVTPALGAELGGRLAKELEFGAETSVVARKIRAAKK